MSMPLVLASGSAIRAQLLRRAGVEVEVAVPRIDEDALRASLVAEDVTPRDLADALAEQKARKISARRPGTLVIGCDQVLQSGDATLSKPGTLAEARAQLLRLRGGTHTLISACVLCEGGRAVWRHIDTARLTMRDFSDDYLDLYLARGWPDIASSVGAYKLEEEGVRLFSRIDGSHFTILGLPLLPLLLHLGRIGAIDA